MDGAADRNQKENARPLLGKVAHSSNRPGQRL
jgi:hypothetical protein